MLTRFCAEGWHGAVRHGNGKTLKIRSDTVPQNRRGAWSDTVWSRNRGARHGAARTTRQRKNHVEPDFAMKVDTERSDMEMNEN